MSKRSKARDRAIVDRRNVPCIIHDTHEPECRGCRAATLRNANRATPSLSRSQPTSE